jgi:predicted O-methyltransferase YrrM
MLKTLEEIFEQGTIETGSNGDRVALSSHTPKEQGLFIQKIYDQVKPVRSLEVGFALGISTLFILEKCRQYNRGDKCHVVIEPYSWGPAAMHNISKEGLDKYIDIRNDLSDKVLPSMYLQNERIQFAYVDTTKVFDVVLQDFYFIDKILDVGGVIILDDASMGGVEKVVRFINTLQHYEIMEKFEEVQLSKKYRLLQKVTELILFLTPLKRQLSIHSLKTSRGLGLGYRCIAFKKTANDARPWDWDRPF